MMHGTIGVIQEDMWGDIKTIRKMDMVDINILRILNVRKNK